MNESKATGEFLVGGDISMLTRTEELGGKFFLNDREEDFFHIFKDSGANCFRLRLFVNPKYKNAVINDLPYTLSLARRIKMNDMKLLLNFHYSDTWAAPAKQEKPITWSDLNMEDLEKKITNYTSSVITEFKNHDVLPDIVQIGNEVTNGILWPEGKISDTSNDNQWILFTRLLKAAIHGVKQPLEAEDAIRIMIHIDQGGKPDTTKWFFDNINKYNVPYDIIGLSYYPWQKHSSMDKLRDNLKKIAQIYDKDIVIVETAYPYRDEPKWKNKKNMAWSISPEGQRAFMTDLIRTIRQTPNDHGAGVIYWYPESIPVDTLHVWNGGATALFDTKGNALPALKAFKPSTAH